MSPRKVFVSSVIRDFEQERAAAKAAVEALRLHPVMAEDFGAKPYSAQIACLEGVRASDIYVGIFGARYGFVTAAGISVTEEEFLEARKRGLPILCFIQEGTKEPEQETFLARLKDYKEGYHVAFFRTPEQLTRLVVQGINDLVGQPDVTNLDIAGAETHLEHHRWGERERHSWNGDSDPWLGAVIFPSRQGEQYLSSIELGRQALQDQLLQPALFGSGAILRRELGIDTKEGLDHLAFEQHDDRQRLAAKIAVHTDGTLVYGFAPGDRDRHRHSILRSFVIDQDEVQRRLTAFLAYADHFYGQLEHGPVIASVYLGVSLSGIAQKQFGRLPDVEPNPVSIPMSQHEKVLRFPQKPRRVARADLADATRLGEELTELIARTFRVAGAYYMPSSR
jgi:hypothetical protein